MFRRSFFQAFLGTVGLVVAFFVVVPAGPASAAPVRIMPLGDSITGSPGCWRALLWERLQANGFTNIDMVGTLPPQGCGVPDDGDNEGHGGALVTAVADQNQLPGWLAATRPDVVLMHFGTNDVWSARCSATYRIANQRQGNFEGGVQVANTGSAPLTGWTVQFTFANGQQVSQLWSGVHTVSGASVTVRNMPWNGGLAPTASTTFGSSPAGPARTPPPPRPAR
jgi:Cellulose binding domain